MGKFEPVFDLQVQGIGCAHLEEVGADVLLFLLDTAIENWSPGNNDGCKGMPSGDGMRKKKSQSSAAMVRSAEHAVDQLCAGSYSYLERRDDIGRGQCTAPEMDAVGGWGRSFCGGQS